MFLRLCCSNAVSLGVDLSSIADRSIMRGRLGSVLQRYTAFLVYILSMDACSPWNFHVGSLQWAAGFSKWHVVPASGLSRCTLYESGMLGLGSLHVSLLWKQHVHIAYGILQGLS